MSLLDTALRRVQDDGGVDVAPPAPAASTAFSTPMATTNSVPVASATDLGGATGFGTTEKTQPVAAPTSLLTAAKAASPAPAMGMSTNAAAPAPGPAPLLSSAYIGAGGQADGWGAASQTPYQSDGSVYQNAIQSYITNGMTTTPKNSADFGFDPTPSYDVNAAQQDFLNAVRSGNVSNVSADGLAALGYTGTNEIVPRNQTGGWNVDPVYGSDQYKTFAQTVGQSLGLSPEKIAQVIGGQMADRYTSGGIASQGGTPFALGISQLGQEQLTALYAAAGKTPDAAALAQAKQIDDNYAAQRAIQGHDGGVMGSDFYKWAALMAGAGLGAAALGGGAAAGAAGAGEVAGAGAGIAAGDTSVAGLAALDSAAAGAGGGIGAGAALPAGAVLGDAGAGVTVIGSAAPAAGITAGQVAAGAAAVGGGAAAAGGGSGTASTTAQPTQAQQLETIQINATKTLAPSLLDTLAPIAAPAVVGQLMMLNPSTATPAQVDAQNALKDFNPGTDQSKWSLGDWQKYLKIASALASLAGSGSGASTGSTPATTAASNQVPTSQALLDPATGLPTTGAPAPATGILTGPKLTPTSVTGAPSAAPAPTPAANVGSFANAGFTAATPQTSGVQTSVGDDQLVSNQLTKILAANSPLIQQARARADALANARGMQNSSIATQSGEEAAIAQSLPIAQADANTYNTTALANQSADITQRALNEQQRQSDNATGLSTQSLLEQARQADIAAKANDAKLAEDARQFNLGTTQKDNLAQLSSDTQMATAQLEAQYKTLTQTSASAADIFNTYQANVGAILASTTMDAANKQAALNIASTNLKSAMAIQTKVSGLNLNDILQFA